MYLQLVTIISICSICMMAKFIITFLVNDYKNSISNKD